jgi:hypothetical protein
MVSAATEAETVDRPATEAEIVALNAAIRVKMAARTRARSWRGRARGERPAAADPKRRAGEDGPAGRGRE